MKITLAHTSCEEIYLKATKGTMLPRAQADAKRISKLFPSAEVYLDFNNENYIYEAGKLRGATD